MYLKSLETSKIYESILMLPVNLLYLTVIYSLHVIINKFNSTLQLIPVTKLVFPTEFIKYIKQLM